MRDAGGRATRSSKTSHLSTRLRFFPKSSSPYRDRL